MNHPKKILIIKTGFSEFLDLGLSTTVSLGDVLICTSLLHLYKKDDVLWLTDTKAKGLLQNNPFIRELLLFGSSSLKRIAQENFDVLINLEKDMGLCILVNQIQAKKKYGFYYDEHLHTIATRKRSTTYLLAGQETHKGIHKNALEILYETVGEQWNGQSLVLKSTSHKKPIFDIGFNYDVGPKWPTKAWPLEHWKELEKILGNTYKISWQQGHKNLSKYITWINSCRLLVTSDSLGQAIGQALGKKVITLYGPTNYLRMHNVPGVHVMASTLKCPFMPCYLPVCQFDKFCMDYISPEKVAGAVRGHLK